ncbi:MAG: 30S ribosomal protein S9 [Parcubacteria group bacterium GW2011_GWA2_33_14]|nr:MAG: 30S ribosomal protein S9 [Parcubacteria group bacterium GW2011_GWA2_33_14]
MLKTKIKKIVAPVKKAEEIKETLVVVEKESDNFLPEDFPIEKELASKPDRYFEAVGRRKTAVARVRLFTRGEKQFLVNGKPYQEYFTIEHDQQTVTSSMRKMKCLDKFKVTVIVRGGGRNAQAEAVRHGTARVLVDFNNNFKKRLRKVGYLTRDPRMRERKKFGLKRARKAPQWAKR